MSLRSQVVRSSSWILLGNGAQQVVVFVLFIYLAKILGPREFGLMATIAVGLDLGLEVMRWGQVQLLMQARNHDPRITSTASWLCLGLGGLFSAGYFIAAEPLARAYGAPELAAMAQITAPVFLLQAAAVAPDAVLRRAFRFKLLSLRSILATLIGSLVAISFAAWGFGALSLAIQRLVQAALQLVTVAAAARWLPGRQFSPATARSLFTEGFGVMAGQLSNILGPRAVDLIVSVTLGPAQLGLLKVAMRVIDFVGQMTIMPIMAVASAAFAKLNNAPKAVGDAFVKMTAASALLVCPLLVGYALVASDLIPLAFGSAWTPSVPVAQILGLTALLLPLNYYFGPVMIGSGNAGQVFRQGGFQIAATLVLSAAAAPFGLIAVAAAQALRSTATSIYNIVQYRKWVGVGPRRLWLALWPTYACTGVMALAVMLVRTVGPPAGTWPSLVASVAAGGLAYVVALLAGDRLKLWRSQAASVFEIVRRRAA